MEVFRQFKYFYIEENQTKRKPKTRVYDVFSESSDKLIGTIKWYAPWRQYCNFIEGSTVWSRGCNRDINTFIQELMDDRKRMKTRKEWGINKQNEM